MDKYEHPVVGISVQLKRSSVTLHFIWTSLIQVIAAFKYRYRSFSFSFFLLKHVVYVKLTYKMKLNRAEDDMLC